MNRYKYKLLGEVPKEIKSTKFKVKDGLIYFYISKEPVLVLQKNHIESLELLNTDELIRKLKLEQINKK